MKAMLPEWSITPDRAIQRERNARFCPRHHESERAVLELDQPMKMIRHDNPGQRKGQLFLLSFSQRINHQATLFKVFEYGVPVLNNGCNQVDLTRH
ncbi:hypothetical protein D3C84_1036150 [compost metagenome]